MRGRRFAPLGLLLAAALTTGCEEIEQVVDGWRPETPHEEYLKGLHDAGLAGTALSQAWIMEAAAAVQSPRLVELPFREETFIAPEAPEAVGYRFRLERGQRVRIALAIEADVAPRVFLDFFRVPDDPADPLRPVQDAVTTAEGLEYEPPRDGDYLVRVQPELLRGGRFRVTLELNPALAFPVDGFDMRAIQSLFGAERDAGARSHAGVDIFAPRSTPVVASAAGRITRANVTNLGGKVVWLRDDRMSRNLYYAHLDSQAVAPGTRVEIGDTLGFVGNTGNARTTPPHLHYGIYYRGEGAVNPLPFLRTPRRTLPALSADLARLGSWGRVTEEGLRLRAAPDGRATVVDELPRHTAVRIVGAAGSWYRVVLPDGGVGYLSAERTEALDGPVGQTVAQSDRSGRSRPADDAPLVEVIAAGSTVPVLGRFGDYWMVRPDSGHAAWVQARIPIP